MTKMLLTIISCVFLCVACSEDGSNYYEQQIDELYNRVITAENEIFDLQTQSEENNTAESDAEEINTTDMVTSCAMSTRDTYVYIYVNLYAQLDDVLKWNNIFENPCKNASVSCTQRIDVIAEELDDEGTRRICSSWNCTDNECTTATYAIATDCNADTIDTVTQFYSTTHLPCVYKIEELLK